MLIETVELTSYGPFAQSGTLQFASGINLLVGQNNSGKSAVLKSLKAVDLDWPHRDLSTFEDIDLKPSVQRVRVRLTGAEFRHAFLRRGGQIWWPIRERLDNHDEAQFRENFFSKEQSYPFEFVRRTNTFNKPDTGPGHRAFDGEVSWSVQLAAERPNIKIMSERNDGTDTCMDLMPHLWADKIFSFDAERLSIGKCAQQDVDELSSNASNLPSVLQRMRGGQPAVFDILQARVREILPSVHGITTNPVGTNQVEVIIWPTKHMDRREYGFPLNDSGTGVAQVIAILTAVMTREQSVIVIDEINSFLHPAAVKALIRILASEFSHHQYILSTHSAEVISSSNPSTLHVIKRNGFNSECRRVSAGDVGELRDLSDHLGISIGDIFAADRVLWVEGRTEELCFPFLMNVWNLDYPRGLIVTPVVATGDFGGKRDAERVFDVYTRLSRVTLPLVRSVTFSFDSEGLDEQQQKDLKKRAKDRALFLPRRHLECYVVHPVAIANFIARRDTVETGIDPDAVEFALKSRAAEPVYRAKGSWRDDLFDEVWLREVDAARLIADTVSTLTEGRVTFSKTNDTLELLRDVVEHRPGGLSGLQEYLADLLQLVRTDVP